MMDHDSSDRRSVLKALGGGIAGGLAGLSLAHPAAAGFDPDRIKLVRTERFLDHVDTWRRDAAPDRVKERLNDRVDKYDQYVETDDEVISQAAIDYGNQLAGYRWREAMLKAFYHDIHDDASAEANTFIVLDYVPKSHRDDAPFTTGTDSSAPPPSKVVFANYERVVSGDLYYNKVNADHTELKNSLPPTSVAYGGNVYRSEPPYDVSEMAFWIYLHLDPFINNDIGQDLAAAYSSLPYDRATGPW